MNESSHKTNNLKSKPVLGDVSFISTVLNEEKSICDFLESLLSQSCLPGEIIIVDGGSRDNTFKLMKSYLECLVEAGKLKAHLNINIIPQHGIAPGKEDILHKKESITAIKNSIGVSGHLDILLISKPGSGIAEGRNTAIRAASGKIICVSDAGCLLDRKWLEQITGPLDPPGRVVVGGMNRPVCRTFLEKNLALCIMPGADEINGKKYMPSSRNISFPRSAWEEAGGYPSYMDFGEDMKFDFELRGKGLQIKFNPEALVFWKMRETWNQVFRQFFRYAKGDAIGNMYSYRHATRFLFLALIVLIIILSLFVNIWILSAFIPLLAAYVSRPYRRLFLKWEGNEACRTCRGWKILSVFFIPILLFYVDIAKAAGYLYGLLKRNKVNKTLEA